MNEAEANQNMEQKCPQCGGPLPAGVLAGLCPTCLFKQGAAADTSPPAEPAAFQPPSLEEVARLFPQLELVAFIGKGGMGAVYQARQPALDRKVALKILPPQTASGPGFVERFNREARALARLSHPNIVAVHEFGQVNGLSYFIMEFVDGLNLRELERAGKLSPREALQIVPQICEALQFAHDEGIVHRDIKPENILLDKKGRVKIADFGIAKILGTAAGPELTQTQSVVGTPHYMAPEQMEKPTAVDHRADIFSLGVVFYEMLTGELPLGKFAPPSSRKVEVDVRLDDVVLRALEKDPELRYQHASQVKTAVDTIVGSVAPPPVASATAMADEILARDYSLSIGSCVRRGWALVKGEFWPFVGITALFLALLGFASSFGSTSIRHQSLGESELEVGSAVALLVWGPLLGGLLCYFLKKIRRQPATVEIAFCGFSHRFLHLFLAGFATSLLTWLGFVCLLLPGIYLLVAWMFTLPLVVDKQLDFWAAMELSRKVVTKHWFKVLGFGLMLWLLLFAGVLALVVGLFVMTPVVLAALMYAYEDIFGGVTGSAPVAATGPTGTVVLPATPAGAAAPPKVPWNLPTKIGVGAVGVLLVVVLVILLFPRPRYLAAAASAPASDPAPSAVAELPQPPMAPDAPTVGLTPEAVPPATFGPVVEVELQSCITGTNNQFLNLDPTQVLTPPSEIVAALNPDGADAAAAWETLGIPEDSRRYQYIRWLHDNGVDLAYIGQGKLVGFDGLYVMAHGSNAANWDRWDDLTPQQVLSAVAVADWSRRAAQAQRHGQPAPPPPVGGGTYNSAAQLDSREPGGPSVNLLTQDQSINYYFKSRSGRLGILQLGRLGGNSATVLLRFKLVQAGTDSPPAAASQNARQRLADRLEAASSISDPDQKDQPLAALALDAARAGEMVILHSALSAMSDPDRRNLCTHEVVLVLARAGLRKDAIELAKGINDDALRNRTLSELAGR